MHDQSHQKKLSEEDEEHGEPISQAGDGNFKQIVSGWRFKSQWNVQTAPQRIH
jgi:hypothetical protein